MFCLTGAASKSNIFIANSRAGYISWKEQWHGELSSSVVILINLVPSVMLYSCEPSMWNLCAEISSFLAKLSLWFNKLSSNFPDSIKVISSKANIEGFTTSGSLTRFLNIFLFFDFFNRRLAPNCYNFFSNVIVWPLIQCRTKDNYLCSWYRLACSKRSRGGLVHLSPSLAFIFSRSFYFAPLPTIWTPGTG